jgi:hypothetical protein
LKHMVKKLSFKVTPESMSNRMSGPIVQKLAAHAMPSDDFMKSVTKHHVPCASHPSVRYDFLPSPWSMTILWRM